MKKSSIKVLEKYLKFKIFSLNGDKMKKILNIVLINLMVFFALISMHEIGHVIFGFASGCNKMKAVLFDTYSQGPYAEIYCTTTNKNLIYLGSLIIPLIFASLFLFTDKTYKNLFFLFLGFSLILASQDLQLFLNDQIFFYLPIVLGFSFLTLGEYFLALNSLSSEFNKTGLKINLE